MEQRLFERWWGLPEVTGGPDYSAARNAFRAGFAASAAERERLEKEKAGAYAERDQLVCALSKLFPASLQRHPDSDTAWEDDWRWIVFIDLPTGQVSWHIHDSEVLWFSHLKRGPRLWDGHSTEEKYARVAALSSGQGGEPGR